LVQWNVVVMHEKQYLIFLDIDARKRHYHITDNGKIIKFVVQLEVKTKDFWKVVLRYDTFHGYAHKDCYDIEGKCKKINLSIGFDDSMTIADEDIDENWEFYREKFLKGDIV